MRKTTDINLFAVPWTVLEYDEAPDACDSIVICAEKEDLATVYSSNEATVNISRKDAIRAAHLMAAAPDLLSALKALVDPLLDDRAPSKVVIERAQRVLDRAAGRA